MFDFPSLEKLSALMCKGHLGCIAKVSQKALVSNPDSVGIARLEQGTEENFEMFCLVFDFPSLEKLVP